MPMLKARTRAPRAPLRLEFRQLEAFLAVVDHGSLRKAADSLGMSQPPLSRQIRQLEDELKSPLFERSASGMVLTGPGQELVFHARAILDRTMQAARDMQSSLGDPMNRLSIGFIDDFLHGFMPGLIHNFVRQRPGLKLRSTMSLTADILDSLRQGRLDAGFVTLPLPISASSLNVIRFAAKPIVAVLPADHRCAGWASIDLKELRCERIIYPIVTPESGFSVQMTGMFQRAGYPLEVATEAWPTDHVMQLVQQGHGITLTATFSFAPGTPSIVQVPLSDPEAIVVPAVIWRGAGATRTLRSFLELCREYAASETSFASPQVA